MVTGHKVGKLTSLKAEETLATITQMDVTVSVRLYTGDRLHKPMLSGRHKGSTILDAPTTATPFEHTASSGAKTISSPTSIIDFYRFSSSTSRRNMTACGIEVTLDRQLLTIAHCTIHGVRPGSEIRPLIRPST